MLSNSSCKEYIDFRGHCGLTYTSPTVFKTTIQRQFMPYLVKIGTPWIRRKLLRLVPSKDIQRIVDIVDIMHEQAVEVYDAKKEALKKGEATVVQQVGRGKDILSILREYHEACGPRRRVLTTNSEGEHGFG